MCRLSSRRSCPQQVSHLSCAVFPSTRMVFLQQQFSALHTSGYTTIQFCHDFFLLFSDMHHRKSPPASSRQTFQRYAFQCVMVFVAVHTCMTSNGILPILRISNRQICNQNCIVRNFQFRKFLPVNSCWFLDSGVVSASFWIYSCKLKQTHP